MNRGGVPRILQALTVVAWAGFFSMTYYLTTSHTGNADPLTDRIYPLSDHGRLVYMTLPESAAFYGLGTLAVVASCLLANLKVREIKRRNAEVRKTYGN